MPARYSFQHGAAAQKHSNGPGPMCRCTSIANPTMRSVN
jgi:hypothetical protein